MKQSIDYSGGHERGCLVYEANTPPWWTSFCICHAYWCSISGRQMIALSPRNVDRALGITDRLLIRRWFIPQIEDGCNLIFFFADVVLIQQSGCLYGENNQSRNLPYFDLGCPNRHACLFTCGRFKVARIPDLPWINLLARWSAIASTASWPIK